MCCPVFAGTAAVGRPPGSSYYRRLLETVNDVPDWFDRAACKGLDPALFFPDTGSRETVPREAERVCAGCPVRLDCLEYAIANHEDRGLWAGVAFGLHGKRRRDAIAQARNLLALQAT